MIRFKDLGLQEQEKLSMKERMMEHIVASCDRDELFSLMAKVNDRITYLDNVDGAFKGLFGRAN
jgi:hypothetical protein